MNSIPVAIILLLSIFTVISGLRIAKIVGADPKKQLDFDAASQQVEICSESIDEESQLTLRSNESMELEEMIKMISNMIREGYREPRITTNFETLDPYFFSKSSSKLIKAYASNSDENNSINRASITSQDNVLYLNKSREAA